jgi:hypothetical protein
MGLRHNHLDPGVAVFHPPGSHIPRHRHLAQAGLVFGLEPLPDTSCGMTLFTGNRFIALQPRVDDVGPRPDRRLRPRVVSGSHLVVLPAGGGHRQPHRDHSSTGGPELMQTRPAATTNHDQVRPEPMQKHHLPGPEQMTTLRPVRFAATVRTASCCVPALIFRGLAKTDTCTGSLHSSLRNPTPDQLAGSRQCGGDNLD